MRGAVVREYGVKEFCKRTLSNVGLVNLIVFGKIGESERVAAVKLSEIDHCAVIAGTEEGALVADCGEEFGLITPSYSLGVGRVSDPKVLHLSFGRAGLLVGDDVYYPEAARTLAKEGAKIFIALPEITNARTVSMARAHAVANGVRLLYCGADYGFAADYNGHNSEFAGNVVSVECALITKEEMLYGL